LFQNIIIDRSARKKVQFEWVVAEDRSPIIKAEYSEFALVPIAVELQEALIEMDGN
jgi:hypothetical protein